jgi:hypothetical protein
LVAVRLALEYLSDPADFFAVLNVSKEWNEKLKRGACKTMLRTNTNPSHSLRRELYITLLEAV